jgi:hypothetical protein
MLLKHTAKFFSLVGLALGNDGATFQHPVELLYGVIGKH